MLKSLASLSTAGALAIQLLYGPQQDLCAEAWPWRILSGFAISSPGRSARILFGSGRRRAGRWCRSSGGANCPTPRLRPKGDSTKTFPYGLRISDDCKRLEVDPHENQVLLLMMDLLAQDFSYSSIVSDLNEKGFRTREGKPWSRVAVFNMMPRLIEVGPRIFSSAEWEKRRLKIARREAP